MKRLLALGLVTLALTGTNVMNQTQTIVLNTGYDVFSQPLLPMGATFTVKSTADTVDANPGDSVCADSCGNCTLRAAIMEANAFAGDDTINFDAGVFNVPKTITLSIPGVNEDFDATGDLDINSDLTITGPGANLTTIDGGGIDRVLNIRGASTVYLSGLTVTRGKTLNISPGGGSGGGIQTQGTLLTLTNVTVDGNEADYGGGIEVDGPVTLNSSTVSNNTALAGGGGGIMNYINGPLILNNSTVSGNTGGYGGGIAASNHGNTLILNNSTVSGNTGEGLNQQAGAVIMKNSILANNGARNCRFQVQSQNSGAINSLGHNLSTDNYCTPASIVAPNVTGGLDQPTDLNNTSAQLAPLDLNLPGTTKTHALCTGPGAPHPSCGAVPSPAIDKGGDCLVVDQRGVPRPQGAACDIGAYEVGVASSGPACTPPPSGLVSWWPGDENANDILGGNNGTIVNGLTFATGKVGPAFSLDGAKDYVQLSNSPYNPFPATGFTYDFWINPFDTPSGRSRTIISNHHAAGNWWNGISLVAGTIELVLQNAATGQTFRWQTSSTLTPNAWQLIAVAYQNKGKQATDAVIYVNGAAQALNKHAIGPAYSKGFTPGYSATDPLGFALGRLLEDAPSAYFRGLIDESEFFNRALTKQEIQAIFSAGSGGKCKAKKDKGMTWFHTASNATYGTITVGCGSAGPNRCDPAHGDRPCTQQLPVLCIYKPKPAFPLPVGLPVPDQYNRWSGGIVATTQPVAGDAFKDSAAVTAYCQAQFGKGWRVAEFHDGLYWNFQAYGGTVSAPTIPSTRFWVHINDQKDGNCWQP